MRALQGPVTFGNLQMFAVVNRKYNMRNKIVSVLFCYYSGNYIDIKDA